MLFIVGAFLLFPIISGAEIFSYSFDKSLDGSTVTHNATKVSFSNRNGTGLNILIQGEIFWSSKQPEECRNGFGHKNLLDYEVCK